MSSPVRAVADVLRERVVPALGRYRWPAVAAYYVRGAADQQMRRRFVRTYDPARNGEYWFLETVGPLIRTAFDVGANEGAWSETLLARAPYLERLYCWEPGSEAFSRLTERLGGDPRVSLVSAAVSDRTQDQAEFFESSATALSSLFAEVGEAAGGTAKTVVVVTVDEEIERLELRTVDLLKIDTEGADFMVLRGSQRSLREQRIRLVQFEYNRPWLHAGATLRAALHFLASCRYDTYLLNGRGLCRFDVQRTPELFHYMNFVAIARDHRDFVHFELQPDQLWG
jgi:FkbM family methyltransferase